MLTLFIFKWVDFASDLNKLLLCKLSSNKLCACFTILVSLKNSFFKKDKNWGPLTTAITSVPHKNLTLDLEQPQQVKEVTVGCNWAKLHTPTQVVHQISVSTWVPLTSACSSFEAKDPVEREGKTHKENSQLKPSTQSFCSSNWRADTTPKRVVIAAKQRGSSATRPAQYLLPHHQPYIYQGDNHHSTLGKVMTRIHIKPSLPTKDAGQIFYIGMLPHKNTPLISQKTTFSPKFIETENVE